MKKNHRRRSLVLWQIKPSSSAKSLKSPVVCSQFDIHPVILTVQVDMLNKRKLGHALFAAFCGKFYPYVQDIPKVLCPNFISKGKNTFEESYPGGPT